MDNYENKVYVLPKKLDEKVARLAFGKTRREVDQANQRTSRLYWRSS